MILSQAEARAAPTALKLLPCVILAAGGLALILAASAWGIGASPDTAVYIVGARNLMAGTGFSLPAVEGGTRPITHHAPLYSVLLAGLGWLGQDPLFGARLINAVAFALTILIVGLAIHRTLAGRSRQAAAWAAFGSAWILVSTGLVEIHLMGWTEGLFILLGLAAIALLARFLEFRSLLALVLCGVLLAAACLARYAGLAWVGAAVIALLLSPQTPRRRIAAAAGLALIALAPLALWMLRNTAAGGSAASRELVFHPPGRDQLLQLVTTLGGWALIPPAVNGWLKLAPYLLLAMGLAAMVYFHSRETGSVLSPGDRRPIPTWVKLCIIFIPVYLAFLGTSITWLDANTPLDNRILSPIYPLLVILAVTTAQDMLSRMGRRHSALFLAAAAGCALLALSLNRTVPLVQAGLTRGIGFSAPEWRRAPVYAELEKLPSGVAIYANLPEPILLHTDTAAFRLPVKYESSNRRENPLYAEAMAGVIDALRLGTAVIVYFDGVNLPSQPQLDELMDDYELSVLWQSPGALILGFP